MNYNAIVNDFNLFHHLNVAALVDFYLTMIYNGETWVATGLKKLHRQNRELGNI